MLHYINIDRIGGRFECYFCGTPLQPVWRNPHARTRSIKEDMLEEPGVYTMSEEKWDASPESCRKLNPLDLSVFERGDGLNMGYRHDSDAIYISAELLAERIKRFTPLIFSDDKLHTFKIPDLRRVAFTWEPTELQPLSQPVEEIMVSPTHHSCGYYGFFKPSIAEVLAQVPENLDPRANAFYIDTSSILIARCGGGQLARTHWVRI